MKRKEEELNYIKDMAAALKEIAEMELKLGHCARTKLTEAKITIQ